MNINWNNLNAKDIEEIKQQLKQDGINFGNANTNNIGSIFDQIRQEQPFTPEIQIHRPGIDDQDPKIGTARPEEAFQEIGEFGRLDAPINKKLIKELGLTDIADAKEADFKLTPEQEAKLKEAIAAFKEAQNGKLEIKPADAGWRVGGSTGPLLLTPNGKLPADAGWRVGGSTGPLLLTPNGQLPADADWIDGGSKGPLINGVHPFDKNDTTVLYSDIGKPDDATIKKTDLGKPNQGKTIAE